MVITMTKVQDVEWINKLIVGIVVFYVMKIDRKIGFLKANLSHSEKKALSFNLMLQQIKEDVVYVRTIFNRQLIAQ